MPEHPTPTRRSNEQISSPRLRVVGPDGQQIGVMSRAEALARAHALELDLVEVAPEADPPVVRITDHARMRYELEQKAKESRRHQTQVHVKEVKLRLKIDDHDFATKRGHVERFIRNGDKAKITVMFRGREQSRPEMGRRLLEKMLQELASVAVVESSPSLDGRSMVMVLAPAKSS